VVSFTPQPFYLRGKSPRDPLDRRLSGPQNRSGRRGEEKLLTLPGLEIRPLGRPVCSQPLYRLCYSGSSYSVHCAGLLDVQNILSADTGMSRQTEGHSFGDHLISETVSVTPTSVIEASLVLCSDSCELMSNQPAL
jgi:hypothetical protein